jgi:hypothetical protein
MVAKLCRGRVGSTPLRELQTNRNRAGCCQIKQENEAMNGKRKKKAGNEQQDWKVNLEVVHPA